MLGAGVEAWTLCGQMAVSFRCNPIKLAHPEALGHARLDRPYYDPTHTLPIHSLHPPQHEPLCRESILGPRAFMRIPPAPPRVVAHLITRWPPFHAQSPHRIHLPLPRPCLPPTFHAQLYAPEALTRATGLLWKKMPAHQNSDFATVW